MELDMNIRSLALDTKGEAFRLKREWTLDKTPHKSHFIEEVRIKCLVIVEIGLSVN